jgi:DNA-binding NarL/FixJ family response regulator
VTRSLTSPSFVGREAELAHLQTALGRAGDGQATAVLVAGEAGVGKTRLLAEFLREAEAAKVHVLCGGSVELSAVSLPYAPFVEALSGLARRLPAGRLAALAGPGRADLARLLPELGPAEPHGDADSAQLQMFERLRGLLERLAAEAPVVLALEDLHWADQSSRDLLAFLVHSLGSARVLVVGTFRSDELNRRHPLRSLLARFERDPHVERLDLRRFDRAELVELLTGLLAGPPETDLVEAVFARSEGNAFFAEELVAAALGGAGDDFPPTLREVLLTRIEGLPPDTQAVLRVAAAAGREVDHELLAAVAGLDAPRLLAALRTAVAEQVLVARSDTLGYAFRHALVAEAVHDDLLPGERTALHAELARVLQQRPELAGRAEITGVLAWHWFAAHDQPRALAASVGAAHAAEASWAYADALRHLERALELWHVVHDAQRHAGTDLAGLLKHAAAVAVRAGDAARALPLVREALTLVDPGADPVRAGLLQMLLGTALDVAGRDGYDAAYEAAVALVPADPPTAERARVLAAWGIALMLKPRYEQARAVCEEVIAVARGIGAVEEELTGLVTLATALAGLGDVEDGLVTFQHARRLAEGTGNVFHQLRVATNLSDLLYHQGRLEEGLATALEGAELARRHGLGRTRGAALLGNACECLIALGRWDEAEPLIREALALESANFSGLQLVAIRAQLDLYRGALAAAARGLRQTDRNLASTTQAQFSSGIVALRAELALREGRYDDARGWVAKGLAMIAEADGRRMYGAELYLLGVRAELERPDPDPRGAEALLERLRSELSRSPGATPGYRAFALLAEAEGAAADPGGWAAAVAAFDDLSRPYPAAYARFRQAAALLAAGDREPAAALLREAFQVADRLGAEPLRADVERLARRGRFDLDGQQQPESNLGLTRREEEVLQLVAEGRSNRQIGEALFISGKTASVHVSNILAKLGVEGRGEAAALAHRLGLTHTS